PRSAPVDHRRQGESRARPRCPRLPATASGGGGPVRRLLTGLLVGTLLLTAAGPVGAAATVEVVRHAGPTRTGTAADVAAASHPDGAEVVVLARADAYGDALAAAPLARLLDAPVLLTAPDALDPTTAAAIRSTGADAAVLVGA